MNLSAIIYSNTFKRLSQGILIGAAATFVIGFTWGGWVTGATAESQVASARQEAVVRVLAPICAENFRRAADSASRLDELEKMDPWTRADHLQKAGWTTFAGSDPSGAVAYACFDLLKK